MNKIRAKKYCIVDGCRNNNKNSDLTFFLVPTRAKDLERRRKWLTVVGREDLLDRPAHLHSHYVCSAHFEKSSIKTLKFLKDTAMPTRCLAHQPLTFCIEDNIEDLEANTGDDVTEDTLSVISNPQEETTSDNDMQATKLEPQSEPQMEQVFLNEPETGQEFSEISNLPEHQTQTKLVTKIQNKRKVKKKNASGHSWMK